MDAQLLVNIGIALLSAAFAAGGAWLAVKTELKYLRRDTDRNHEDIKAVEERRRHDTSALHDRITGLNTRMTKGGINGQ
jgi:hypothetical protein